MEAVDKLSAVKETIRCTYMDWKNNIDCFNAARSFVFNSNLSASELSGLAEINKPAVQFNILTPYIDRQLGEFSQQEPSVSVRGAPDAGIIDPRIPQFLEGHLMAIFYESKKGLMEYGAYKDSMSGGFGVLKFWTEYESPYSFNQVIKCAKVDDPTMVLFDPSARLVTKSDGNWCAEIYPMTMDDFRNSYPEASTSGISFKSFGDFNWSYKDGNKEMVLCCRYYEKKKKKKMLYYLANGQAMIREDYKDMLIKYDEMGEISQPPAVISKRWTEVTIITQYTLIENQILDEFETDYTVLPLIFVDGNSIYLNGDGGNICNKQITRPYLIGAFDAQRLMNLAGQTIANEIENMVTHKFLIAKESIPEQYADEYANVQRASSLVYNAFMPNGAPIPAPQPVPRVPINPEVVQTFEYANQLVQNIIGAYDPQLGVNRDSLSGIAIENAATQGNATAMPYIVNFLAAMNQLSQGIVDLIPKVYLKKQVLNGVSPCGDASSITINDKDDPNSLNVNYKPGALKVTIEAGINFEVQKNKSLKIMMEMMQAVPSFAQMMNQSGLPILVDQLDIRGVDELKQKAQQFTQQQAMQQQQAMAQGQQQNPIVMLKQQELQLKQQQMQQQAMKQQQDMAMKQRQMEMDNAHKAADINIDQQNIHNERLKMEMDYQADQQDLQVQLDKANTEKEVHATNAALKASELQHRKNEATMKHSEQLMKHTGDILDKSHDIITKATIIRPTTTFEEDK
jgi:hypothetical protein